MRSLSCDVNPAHAAESGNAFAVYFQPRILQHGNIVHLRTCQTRRRLGTRTYEGAYIYQQFHKIRFKHILKSPDRLFPARA